MSDPHDPQLPERDAAQPPAQPPAIAETRREARAREQAAAQWPESIDTVLMPTDAGVDTVLMPTPDATATTLFPVRPPAAAGSGGSSSGAGEPPRGGVFAAFAAHPRAWLFSALAAVFVLLAVGSVFAGIAVGSPTAQTSSPGIAPVTSASPTPTPRPTPSALADPTHLRTCTIASLASATGLGTFSGSVINATTGEVLFDRNGSVGTPTASVMKTLTSAAALAVLGPSYRFTTNVVQGSDPGTIVLVGGGDPTLSALPAGKESVYQGAPKLSTLAAQVTAALDPTVPITNVVLDATMWSQDPADNYDASWPANERTLGYQPIITALMVDGDRANPAAQTSPRSTDPVGAAGTAFLAAMGLPSSTTVTRGSAPAGAKVLGTVQSQPVSTLIGQMLPPSDNTLAEMLDRVTSKVSGQDGSAASLNTAIPAALSKYGLSTTGLVIKDGSGESNLDKVPPAFVAQLMAKTLSGAQGLDVIYNALPISGKTGTLASRFTGANAVARGAINAKTGSIANLYALAGIAHASDGTALAFAFFAGGKVSASSAMAALDTITTGIFTCGNNLSNN